MYDIWDAYIADRKQELTDTTRLEDAWKALRPFFGEKRGDTLVPDDCREYARLRKGMGLADSTIRTELEYLRAAVNMRYGKGRIKLWTPPASKPREDYIRKERINGENASPFDILMDTPMAPHVKLFIIIALTTGARMGAILELTWDRVDFVHGTVDFQPAGRHKTNKGRVVVPMNKRLRAALEEAHKAALSDYVIEYNGGPIASVKKAIRQLAKRSGIRCSPHIFRHTAGVWMAQADVPMQKISQYLGHTSIKVTERVYARYSPSYMKDAASALDW
jgi:integrase